ncbi:MAG: purine nucleosidase [Acidimicrobiales bacterium]
MTQKIIIDTDPGQDDAVAILLAFGSALSMGSDESELEVLALTSVAGNVPLDYTTRNCLMLTELAGRTDVPVHQGAVAPLQRKLVTAEHVHGPTGIDGIDRPEPTTEIAGDQAAQFIVDTVMSTDDVMICTLGPLTNIARALEIEPAIVERVPKLVLMGGGHFEGGNITPMAEFNIYVDPQAAQAVFDSGIDLVMMPLDVTHKAISTPPRIDAFRALGTVAGDAVAGMLDFYHRFDIERYGMEGGPLHDPCVVAYLLQPDLFAGRHVNVAVETESKLCMGATVVDWWGATQRKPNCQVMRDIDADGFYALLVDRIGRLG